MITPKDNISRKVEYSNCMNSFTIGTKALFVAITWHDSCSHNFVSSPFISDLSCGSLWLIFYHSLGTKYCRILRQSCEILHNFFAQSAGIVSLRPRTQAKYLFVRLLRFNLHNGLNFHRCIKRQSINSNCTTCVISNWFAKNFHNKV